jgi:predicted site-specific integrase-resolvase
MWTIPLSDFGLMTVAEAAAHRGITPRAVLNWINAGLLPVTVAGTGLKRVYLIPTHEVKRLESPKKGRRPAKG